jgi:hypothetical protein
MGNGEGEHEHQNPVFARATNKCYSSILCQDTLLSAHLSRYIAATASSLYTLPPTIFFRNERLQVQTLRLAGHTQKFTAERQVSYPIAHDCVTPELRKGHPATLGQAQVDELSCSR